MKFKLISVFESSHGVMFRNIDVLEVVPIKVLLAHSNFLTWMDRIMDWLKIVNFGRDFFSLK